MRNHQQIVHELIQVERELDKKLTKTRKYYLIKLHQYLVAIDKLYQQSETDERYLETLNRYLKQAEEFRKQFPDGKMSLQEYKNSPEVVGWNAPKVPLINK